MDSIEAVMRDITNLEDPQVFSVSIQKDDHSSLWTAYCTLRADGRHFSVKHEDPVLALVELTFVLRSLVCPYCKSLRKGEQDEFVKQDKDSITSIYTEGRE